MRSTREVYTSHVKAFGDAAFASGSVDAILEDYADGAILVTSQGTFEGKQRLRGFFDAVLAEFRKPGASLRMEGDPSFERDVARFSWSARTPDHVFRRATDTLVVRGDKIVAQTFSPFIENQGVAAQGGSKPSLDRLLGTPHGEDLRRHSTNFREGNAEKVIEDFAPDAVILTPDGAMRGHAAISQFFHHVLANPNLTFKTNFATTARDIGFIEWSAAGWPWGTDTFVYDSTGKITIQTFDGVADPKQ